MNVFFVTGHDAAAPRKVDFHFWAQSLERRGIRVDFMTVGLSDATAFKKNGRLFSAPFNQWVTLSSHVDKFVWKPLFHPFTLNSRSLDSLTGWLFQFYPLLLPRSVKERVERADVIVVESGVGLTLIKAMKEQAPRARLVYSVSDLLETLTFHPLVFKAEREAIECFDMIRVPAMVMKESFPQHIPIHYIPPGLNKADFDQPVETPYKYPHNAISIGDMLFDAQVLETLADNFTEWTFHLFGKKATLNNPKANVIEHGEKPFGELIPYLKHADIGIAPYKQAPRVEYISQSSLKLVQYTYCRLPVVAPTFAAAGRSHVLGFDTTSADSLIEAFHKAVSYDRNLIDPTTVLSWDAVAQTMFLDGAAQAAPSSREATPVNR